MERTKGRATPAGTERFAQRAIEGRGLPPEHFRASAGVRLSSLGLGTYLGRPDAATDHAVEQAVAISLSSGRVNVLDTAINYRLQRAERSVGRALKRLFDSGPVARDEILVATKIGYLAPDAEAGVPAPEWIERELLRPGILAPEDVVNGSHAMTPRFLEDQFERSRRNLGLETIDLLYLHNAPDAQLPVVGATEFARRLEEAFETLEAFRASGRLGWYGLATWDALRSPMASPDHFELEVAVRTAERVAGTEHGFRFVQFPFNLALPEAAVARTQTVGPERCTLFEAIRRLRLGSFTSVPLLQGQLARNGPKRDGLRAGPTALQFARSAPGTIGPLVGQKQPEHLSENLEVAALPPWGAATFEGLLR